VPINQQDVRISSPASEAETPPKPYSAIPKVKTTFGLNIEMLREPHRAADYFERSFHELGFIFKQDVVPGLPETVVNVLVSETFQSLLLLVNTLC